MLRRVIRVLSMLTAVIRADGRPGALAATFSVLIPAVAEGVLGHAVVVDPALSSEIARIADETGAAYVASAAGTGWAAGAGQARGDWLVLLDAGDLPEPHWTQGIERHLLLAASRPALMPLRGAGALAERGSLLLGQRGLRAGLIAPKQQILSGRLVARPLRLTVHRERAGG